MRKILLLLVLMVTLVGCAAEKKDIPVETSRLGVMVGSTNEKYADEHYGNAKIERFNNYVDSTAALLSNKLDYAMMDYTSALNFTRYNKELILASEFLTDEKLCIGLNKSKPELTQGFRDKVDAYIADGTMDEIISHWIKEDGSSYDVVDTPVLENAPIIRAAIVSTREPTTFVLNNEYAGLDIELINRIVYDLGYRVEYSDMQWGAVIAALGSDKFDVTLGMYNTPERADKVNFTSPYFTNPQVLITKTGSVAKNSFISGITSFVTGLKESFIRTFIMENRWKLVVSGLQMTMVISVSSMLCGTLFGAFICLLNRSKNKLVSWFAKLYIRIIQGTPIVVMLMILYYVIFGSVDISAVIVAVIGFSLNFAAYSSEMFRTGIDAIDKGQLEAASASGFSKLQAFFFITLPQAARHVIPIYKGEFISMVKMTSVVGYIAIQDLTKVSDIIRSRTYEAFFPLIATAVIYFVITYLFIFILNLVEVKIDPKRRKRIVKGVRI